MHVHVALHNFLQCNFFQHIKEVEPATSPLSS